MKAPRQAPERKSATRLNFSMEEGSKLRSLSRQPKKMMLLGPFRSNMADILEQKYQMIYIPTHDTGYEPSVVFSQAVLGQTDEGVRCVPELPLPAMVQHQGLDPLEGGEDRLRAASTEGGQDDTTGHRHLFLNQGSLVLFKRAEHQSRGGTLLHQRRQDSTVKAEDSLSSKL